MSIRAIETTYRGYRFRSRTEARWAVFFDALGIRWDYEIEGFELSDGTRYLPDFRLHSESPTKQVWLEVKGSAPTESEVRKLTELCDASPQTSAIFGIGLPGSPNAMVRTWFYDEAKFAGPRWEHRNIAFTLLDAGLISYDLGATAIRKMLRNAITVAKSARFEFGENGAA